MQYLSKLVALTLATPVGAALSIQLAIRDRVIIEPTSSVVRETQGCSSLDGPFCPALGSPSDAADDGLRWRLLLRAGHRDNRPRVSTLSPDEHVETPMPVEDSVSADEHSVPKLSHRSASLDFSALGPWMIHVPHHFSQGLFRRHELTWAGNWRVTTASHKSRATWTAIELTGHGSVKFSRAVVVSELPVQAVQGALLVICYLGEEVICRHKIDPIHKIGARPTQFQKEWVNSACSLQAVDELVFVPVGSAILGGMVVIASVSTSVSSDVTDGFLVNKNVVPATQLSLDRPWLGRHARWQPRRMSISPSAVTHSLREAWHVSKPLARSGPPNIFPDVMPQLDDLKSVFEALEAGMEYPVGVTWRQIEAEASRFHDFMSQHGTENLKYGWPKLWNMARFHVLDACFLRWSDNGHSSGSETGAAAILRGTTAILRGSTGSTDAEKKDPADTGTESVTSAFFESILGNQAGSLLSGLVQRFSSQDSGFADKLEAAISTLMESVVDTAEDTGDPKLSETSAQLGAADAEALNGKDKQLETGLNGEEVPACRYVRVTNKPLALATKSQLEAHCGSSCASKLGLGDWDVCEYQDGQIDGPGHGGDLEPKQESYYGCFIEAVCDEVGGCCQISDSNDFCASFEYDGGTCSRLNGRTIGCNRGVWKADKNYDASSGRCLAFGKVSQNSACRYFRVSEKPRALASQSQLINHCGNSCASELALEEWDVCEYQDGQIYGLGHGGALESKQEGHYSCFIEAVCDEVELLPDGTWDIQYSNGVSGSFVINGDNAAISHSDGLSAPLGTVLASDDENWNGMIGYNDGERIDYFNMVSSAQITGSHVYHGEYAFSFSASLRAEASSDDKLEPTPAPTPPPAAVIDVAQGDIQEQSTELEREEANAGVADLIAQAHSVTSQLERLQEILKESLQEKKVMLAKLKEVATPEESL